MLYMIIMLYNRMKSVCDGDCHRRFCSSEDSPKVRPAEIWVTTIPCKTMSKGSWAM